eukprot:1027838-Pelagomonas_calceolata.AAC.3
MVGGAYAAMALTGSGSFLLERCFDMADGRQWLEVRRGRDAQAMGRDHHAWLPKAVLSYNQAVALEGSTKEAIISELLTRERDLESKYWGPRLLKRLGAEAYKRDPLQWRCEN